MISNLKPSLPTWVGIFALLNFYIFQVSSEKSCATFHSLPNFRGDNFHLDDGEQTSYLPEDGKYSTDGWNITGSIKVERGCELELCSEMYFDGNCQTLPGEMYPSGTFGMIGSVKCDCPKECKCSDIYMKQSTCARAYLRGGCRTCNAQYLDLSGSEASFPQELGRVEAFRLRKGCTLKLYSEEEYEGDEELIVDQVYENYQGRFNSYDCTCNNHEFEEKVKPPRPSSYPPLINIPDTLDELIRMKMNTSLTNSRAALEAAYTSMKNGRSGKNAYILLIGSTGSGKSSAINLLFDNPNVTKVGADVSTTTDIHEFRIPVPIDELGISNSELRVIDTPGLGDTRGLQRDATFLSTLDAYLSSHPELSTRIPNVVLIFHKFTDNRFSGEGSNFVKMLRGLDAFRERITDKTYSNVIFVFSHFCSEVKKEQRRPDSKLKRFKKTIEDFTLFPKPLILTVAENKGNDAELPMVNGYYKLPNGEYYPRNLFSKMELVTSKGGDPIGLGVFRSAFRDSTDFNVSRHDFHLMKQSSRFDYYFKIISNAVFGIEETEISGRLQQTWDTRMPPNLKQEYSSSLPYLKKALNIRNINNMKDVPRTAKDVLDLLTSIKHDPATMELLRQSLNIAPPNFPRNTVAGYGYNVFEDEVLPKSPFKMGAVTGSDIGYLIPQTLSCTLDPGSKQRFETSKDQDEYVQSRLQHLGIDGIISNGTFKGRQKPGYNLIKEAFRVDGCSLSATKEFKLFDFTLNDKPEFSDEFKAELGRLEPFNATDNNNVEMWRKFFREFGTHVVRKVGGGGAIHISLESNKPFNPEMAKSLFKLINFAEDLTFVDDDDKVNGFGEGTNHTLTFVGGDGAFHTRDLTQLTVENAAKLIGDWKKSLRHNPAILEGEMKLIPMSLIVRRLGQNYTQEVEKAAKLLFKSELNYDPPKKHLGPDPAREDTQMMTFLNAQKQMQDKIDDLMTRLEKSANDLKEAREEMDNRQREWQNEMREKDEEHRREMRRMNEQFEQRLKAAEEKYRRDAEAAAQARINAMRPTVEYRDREPPKEESKGPNLLPCLLGPIVCAIANG